MTFTQLRTFVEVATAESVNEAARVLLVSPPAEELARQVLLLREPGSGTRSTAEELFDELGISPATLTLGSNGAIRESVQVGLGVTLISRDAVARELEEGSLQEWRCPTLPRQRSWHLVARADEELPPTAALFLGQVTTTGEEGFNLLAADRPD